MRLKEKEIMWNKIKYRIALLLLMLSINQGIAQGNCWFSDLQVVFKNTNDTEFKRFLTNTDGFENFKRLHQIIDNHEGLTTNSQFLANISKYDNDQLRQLGNDLSNSKWGSGLEQAFRNHPNDVNDVWLKLKEDPAFAWELSKTDPKWERWSLREFFKDVTAKGQHFEKNVCLVAFSNRNSSGYTNLKNKLKADFEKNLDEYDLFSQVQLKYNSNGDYFVADQVFVKYALDTEGLKEAVDIIIIENKLKSTTQLTTPQSRAFTRREFIVRSLESESMYSSGNILNNTMELKFSDAIQWYKVHDGTTGEAITGINRME